MSAEGRVGGQEPDSFRKGRLEKTALLRVFQAVGWKDLAIRKEGGKGLVGEANVMSSETEAQVLGIIEVLQGQDTPQDGIVKTNDSIRRPSDMLGSHGELTYTLIWFETVPVSVNSVRLSFHAFGGPTCDQSALPLRRVGAIVQNLEEVLQPYHLGSVEPKQEDLRDGARYAHHKRRRHPPWQARPLLGTGGRRGHCNLQEYML